MLPVILFIVCGGVSSPLLANEFQYNYKSGDREFATITIHTKRKLSLQGFFSFVAGGNQCLDELLPPTMTTRELEETDMI